MIDAPTKPDPHGFDLHVFATHRAIGFYRGIYPDADPQDMRAAWRTGYAVTRDFAALLRGANDLAPAGYHVLTPCTRFLLTAIVVQDAHTPEGEDPPDRLLIVNAHRIPTGLHSVVTEAVRGGTMGVPKVTVVDSAGDDVEVARVTLTATGKLRVELARVVA